MATKTASKKKPVKKPVAAKKAGRPSTYTREKSDYICRELAKGRSLASICTDVGMPQADTFRAWVIDDIDGISSRSARAYEIGHDAIADECVMIADEVPPMNPITGAYDSGAVQHKRLRIDTRMRLLGKWAPKKYGDKIDVEHSGKIGIETLITEAGAE